MANRTRDIIDLAYNEGYDKGSGNTIDEFMQALLDGYDVVEWRGKTYRIKIKEQKNEFCNQRDSQHAI